ncbi:MAG: 3-oxoacyl-[acyl-carrier-protein] reductase [Candidatus Aminicenantia bacterium]
MSFAGKISLITGASQGIGEEIAYCLSEAGSEVVLVDIQLEKLQQVSSNINQGRGKAHFHQLDVSKNDQVEKVVNEIIEKLGKIDYLVNNAGITRDTLLMRMKEEDWDKVIEVNLKGTFNFSRAVIRHMLKNKYGRIVNISSVVGLMGNAGQTNYAASKAGIIGFSKSLAREVASREITVNAIAPGYIATQMTENLPDNIKEMFLNLIPMRRFGTPKEIAQAVKFLLSDEASYITGQVINVNGGLYM